MSPKSRTPSRRDGGNERELSLAPLCVGGLILVVISYITEVSNFSQIPSSPSTSVPRKFLGSDFLPVLVDRTVETSLLLENGTQVLKNVTYSSISIPYDGTFVHLLTSETISLIHLGCLFLLWYLCNVYFNIFNKQVLKVFPHPYLITTLQFGVGGAIVVTSWILRLAPIPQISINHLISIAPVALMHALGNLFTNLSVKDVAVSFTHVIKSMEPFFSVGLSALAFNKMPSWLVVLSLVPIVAGVALASVTEVSFNWNGFLSAMASNLTFQSRNVLSKQLMVEDLKLDNISLFGIVTLFSFLIMIPVTAIREREALKRETYKPENFDVRKTGVRALLAALCFHSYQQVSYMILQRVTPVTHAVGNCMKRVIVIVSSVVFFRTPVSQMNGAGIALALVGVFLYSQAKLIKLKGN